MTDTTTELATDNERLRAALENALPWIRSQSGRAEEIILEALRGADETTTAPREVICYWPCKAHSGQPWFMTIKTVAASRQVCPICHPPGTAEKTSG